MARKTEEQDRSNPSAASTEAEGADAPEAQAPPADAPHRLLVELEQVRAVETDLARFDPAPPLEEARDRVARAHPAIRRRCFAPGVRGTIAHDQIRHLVPE